MNRDVFLHGIECYVPEVRYSQSEIMRMFLNWLDVGPRKRRLIEQLYRHSAIKWRHSVLGQPGEFFVASGDGEVASPSTKYRNDIFAEKASGIAIGLAGRILRNCPAFEAEDITHIIGVSCTGFSNPGFDFDVVKALELSSGVKRYSLGFMGCYAAMPALRMADTICRADPEAVVLVIGIELCTLHAQLREDMDSVLGASLFADGAAAAIVSAKRPARGSVLRLERFESRIIADSESDMAWYIGDTGFDMVLSQYVPRIIDANIERLVGGILSENGLSSADIVHWAVHPGGKAILDKVEASLGIEGALEQSREILRRYGNMSSVTIMFVLKEMMEKGTSFDSEPLMALAFGPGLTVESALMSKVAFGGSGNLSGFGAAQDIGGVSR